MVSCFYWHMRAPWIAIAVCQTLQALPSVMSMSYFYTHQGIPWCQDCDCDFTLWLHKMLFLGFSSRQPLLRGWDLILLSEDVFILKVMLKKKEEQQSNTNLTCYFVNFPLEISQERRKFEDISTFLHWVSEIEKNVTWNHIFQIKKRRKFI